MDSQPASVASEVANLTLTNAGSEYPQIVIADANSPSVKKIQVTTNTGNSFKVAYVPGGPYFTVKKDQAYWEDGLDTRSLTLYIVGTVNGDVAEILWWK